MPASLTMTEACTLAALTHPRVGVLSRRGAPVFYALDDRHQVHESSDLQALADLVDAWERKTETDPCNFGLGPAVHQARKFADESGMPQTVYRDSESGGWWHTNPFALRLSGPGCLRALTVLPARYFVA